MTGKWKRAIGSKPATFSGVRPRSSAIRRRRNSLYLAIQELECRTLLSVTTSFSSGVLDVELSAAGDQALIAPSGSTVLSSGADYSTQSFSGVTALLVQGANTSSQDEPNQSVTFGGTGGTIAFDAASGTDALSVSGVTSVTFTDVTIHATSGNVDVEASETTPVTNGTLDSASGSPSRSATLSPATRPQSRAPPARPVWRPRRSASRRRRPRRLPRRRTC